MSSYSQSSWITTPLIARTAERLGKAPHHKESRQQDLPVDTALALSSSKCYFSGKPPFVVTIRETCKTNKPIWGLISLNTPWSHGVEIRDPTRRYRKIGPSSDWIEEEWSEEERDLNDSKLVRLGPGEVSEISFTFSADRRAGGLRSSDMRTMTVGNTYQITLRQRRWRWMFEDEMPPEMTEEECKTMLASKKPMVWKADCIESYEVAS